MTSDETKQNLRDIANGIQHTLVDLYGERPPFEFLFVMVSPDGEQHVSISTITGISNPANIMRVGRHIMDMAVEIATRVDPDADVQGHA